MTGQCRIENIAHERRLSGSRNTGNHCQETKGEGNVDFFEVVGTSAVDDESLPVRDASFSRNFNLVLSTQVETGDRIGIVGDIFSGATRDHFTTMCTGTGSQVNHIIRSPDCFLIVFDH